MGPRIHSWAHLSLAAAVACGPASSTPSKPSPSIPTTSTGAPCVRALSLDSGRTCAIRADDTAWCWGSNSHGALGTGDRVATGTPAPVQGIGPVISLSTGNAHTCAVDVGGLAFCWGWNEHGQIGDGTLSDVVLLPSQVVDASGEPLRDLAEVTTGGGHSCARNHDGGAWCWGTNRSGAVGQTSPEVFPYATPVDLPGAASQVVAANDLTCAIVDGALWCWGWNGYGQIGDGTYEDALAPIEILPDATEVMGSVVHTCALSSDGSAWCWGANADGALGTGTGQSSPVPVPVAAEQPLTDLAVAGYQGCARGADEQWWCWGSNIGGQLALPLLEAHPTPTVALADRSPQRLALGTWHGCGVFDDGALWCWGFNDRGALGNGSMDIDVAHPPEQVVWDCFE